MAAKKLQLLVESSWIMQSQKNRMSVGARKPNIRITYVLRTPRSSLSHYISTLVLLLHNREYKYKMT